MPTTKKSKKSETSVSLVQSKFETLKNGNIEIGITIPWEMVKVAYQKALKKMVGEATLKGFRKGKAPQKLVEEHLGKQKIYQEMVPDLFTQV
ncbi:trigger factor family protein [Patescibacteria group bacterium]|nr:trigger factor family protein [Patescibacteria group bacterium]